MTRDSVALQFVGFLVRAWVGACVVGRFASLSRRCRSAPLGRSLSRQLSRPVTAQFGDGSGFRFDERGLTFVQPEGRGR